MTEGATETATRDPALTRPGGRWAKAWRALGRVLDRVLNATALRLLAMVAVVAAVVMFGLVLLLAEEVTASWGVATVGLLTLGASLFSAASATSSAGTSQVAAQASVRSADVAERAERAGQRAVEAAQRSAEAADHSVRAARRAHQLQLYELARAAHTDLTSGPVAAARGRLGMLSRAQLDHERAVNGPSVDATAEALSRGRREQAGDGRQLRDDWFTLLWCFQRIRAVDDVMSSDHPESAAEPQGLLRRLVIDQLGFLNEGATYIRAALEEVLEDYVDDLEAKHDFVWLVEALVQTTRTVGDRPGGGAARATGALWRPKPDGPQLPTRYAGAWADIITTTDHATRARVGAVPAAVRADASQRVARPLAERYEAEERDR